MCRCVMCYSAVSNLCSSVTSLPGDFTREPAQCNTSLFTDVAKVTKVQEIQHTALCTGPASGFGPHCIKNIWVKDNKVIKEHNSS